MLTLYHYWDSTCSMKVRFCLAEKRIPHEKVFVDLLAFEQLRPAYLAINPNGVAPSIVHDGRPIIESTVINEYLEEVFPDHPLLPDDPVARAAVRTLVRIEDGKMHEAFRPPTFNLMIKPMFAGASDDEIERVAATHPQRWIGEYWKKTIRSPVDQVGVEDAYAGLKHVMQKLETTLGDGRPWLAGDHVTLAECAFVALIDRVEHLGRADLFDAYPALNEWRARLKARPTYGEAIPPEGKRLFSPVPSLSRTAGEGAERERGG